MSVRLGSATTWRVVLGVLVVASFAAAVPLTVLSGQIFNALVAGAIGVPSAGIGVADYPAPAGQPARLAVPRQWRLHVLSTAGAGYGCYAYRFGHHLPLGSAAVALAQIWGPSLVVFAADVLLFPDGRLTRASGAGYFGSMPFRSRCCSSPLPWRLRAPSPPTRPRRPTGGLAAVDYPVGWFNAVQGMIIVLILGLSLAFIVRQALSWRRATGERRQQLKWLASGAFVSVVCLIVAGNFGSSGNGPTGAARGVLSSLVWFGVAALPVSIGVAILKYRLYEIDRIISRTLAYAIVTGLLVGLYAGLVLLATEVLKFLSRWRWRPPPWWRRRCSIPSGGGCSTPWTGGSTGPATTPSGW